MALYYELGREARAEILKGGGERWRGRLRELGVRVGSALVEMGDLKAAGRHLEGLSGGGDVAVRGMLCLLYIRIGNLAAAKAVLEGGEDGVLEALFLMAEGKWEGAVERWKGIVEAGGEEGDMARSNLAVCLLYTGRLEEVCSLRSVLGVY